MIRLVPTSESILDQQYAESAADPEFSDLLPAHGIASEDELADLIELDGRKRIALGRPVELRRYVDAVPGIRSITVALDAAIDVTLRSMSRGQRPDADAVDTLILNYPDLVPAIREAAMLGRSWLSTRDVHRVLDAEVPGRVPADFGPLLPDGRARYRLVELLGAGGSGAVYRAEDRILSEPDRPALVAVKVMRGRDESPWGRQRFVEEATKARRITHPNVARVLDRGISADDTDFIVYEYIEGGDLQTWFESLPGLPPAGEAAALVAKAARAVHAAHTAGLVHCDLKPGNILLDRAGEPKVTDFGIAVRAGAAPDPAGVSDRHPIGSLPFMPPEQFHMKDGALASPADVYALGGVLHFLLSGRYPNGDSPVQIRASHDPAAPSAPDRSLPRRAGVDADLEAICRRALAPAPEGRHSSAADLAADLEAWLDRRPIPWTDPSARRIAWLLARRRPWTAAFAAAATVLLVGGVVATAYLWNVASTRAAEARAVVDRFNNARDQVGKALRFMETMRGMNLSRDLLPMLMMIDALAGDVLVTPDGHSILWNRKEQIVSDMVRTAHREGRADDFETLVWQSGWGYWLVTDRRPDQAIPILEDNLARWSARLRPEDPWLGKLRGTLGCAQAQRILTAGPPFDISEGSELRRIEELLHTSDGLFTHGEEGGPIHLLTLNTLVEIYTVAMPESGKQLRACRRRIKSYE